jgi:predicted ABC-type transport system involved in lysophospholipase L1 biosynthesis ATPase subunit
VTPILEAAGVSKDYHGLRPLRIDALAVEAGERVALVGFDQIAAEVLVNLLTGATLPDRGHVALFGRRTDEIVDATDWLATVDRVGIVSERAVLLEGLTALQNLAMPFTLDVEPLEPDTRERAEALAREVDLPSSLWNIHVGALAPGAQMRIRLGRALALQPEVLLLEHASARLPSEEASALAGTITRTAAARGVTVVALGVDAAFARTVAVRVLTWDPASGRLGARRGWFGR